MTSFAVTHKRIRLYTPKHNGKVERYQQTLDREVLLRRTVRVRTARRDQIRTWLTHYNYHRPHTLQAINPRLTISVTKVVPS